ncbi:MAG: S46 family peptidase [Bacteroidetes bacterium]|nr:S46 family peptidase [Bacteroidota bacterium]
MSLYRKKIILSISLILFVLNFYYSDTYANPWDNEKTIKAGKFDTGKMWAFDFPPVEYFEETYGFKPTEEWLEDVRLSALRIPGCTASFVSEDGLIMTNNHCSDRQRKDAQIEGENLEEDGFYAGELSEERKLPNFYADQLVFMKDVSQEIQNAIDAGKTESEKIANKKAKIDELTEKYINETGLKIEIESFYNNSRFSVYGFKRYNDIRLVFLPEESIGYFGGDFDNFTYPRYNLDCAFYRVYENDEPLKSKNYFKWSKNGAQENEVIFSVGNPGRTNRLKTVAQLKYLRDTFYGNSAFITDGNYQAFEYYKSIYPERADELEKFKTGIGNGQKVLTNIVNGLNDPSLLERKIDFENKLIKKVESDNSLKEKYGMIWETMERTASELINYNKKISVYKPGKRSVYPSYFSTAEKLITLADQLNLPEEERLEAFKEDKLKEYISSIFPAKYDELFEKIKLSVFVNFAVKNLGNEHFITKDLFNGLNGMEAAEYLLKNSVLGNKESVIKLAEEGAEKILNSGDVFIKFITSTKDELKQLEKLETEAKNTEEVYENLLGQLLYEAYGTSIPPDANFTLRISDGVLKDFNYNGTKTPLKTTYFGLYDRYYSFEKEYPWNLPKKWQNPPMEFKLTTPFNFTSTQDIVGGNSGSAIINKNAEVVGLAFDGNINSIIGNFIYLEEENRCVAVTSEGMVEAFMNLYGYKKLASELINGQIPKEVF